MRIHAHMSDDRGFSLIELIVIMAMMVVAIGMGSLGMSLLTGSEAKQACEKINAQLNEAKTGSMSRYDEDLNIVYVDDPSLYDWADKEGYYAVKQMTTLGINTTSGASYKMPTEVPLTVEHRYLCNNRVSMVLTIDGGSTYDVNPVSTDGIGFDFDRATGLYKNVRTGCSVTGSGTVASSNTYNTSPSCLEMKSGLKSYKINFVKDTGKHSIEK
jgi:type II secretory pathway pseudopilin PulG